MVVLPHKNASTTKLSLVYNNFWSQWGVCLKDFQLIYTPSAWSKYTGTSIRNGCSYIQLCPAWNIIHTCTFIRFYRLSFQNQLVSSIPSAAECYIHMFLYASINFNQYIRSTIYMYCTTWCLLFLLIGLISTGQDEESCVQSVLDVYGSLNLHHCNGVASWIAISSSV